MHRHNLIKIKLYLYVEKLHADKITTSPGRILIVKMFLLYEILRILGQVNLLTRRRSL